MFFRQLQYLVALAQEEHFGRAASRCNVSQPSLSSAIKQLELSLGVPIVLRGRRFLGLTNEGKRIIEWAERVISQRDAMLVELSGMRNNFEGKLRLGAMPNSSPVLPLFSKLLAQKHPGVEVDIKFLGIEETKQGLSNFSLDVGITYIQQTELSELHSMPIYDERLSLLVPDTKEYAKMTAISWAEAAKLPLCLLDKSMHERKIIDEAFAKSGNLPDPTVTTSDSILNLIFHVMFADLVTIIPKHFIRMPGQFPGVKALDLIEPEISQEVGLVWSPSEPMMPMANVMISIVKELKESGELEERLGDLSTP
ncbi:MAG: LysR family transcriptional regulator [Rhodospirillales bacterium]|nr:LysR family transcriptional regulator [Rhodospirillales bacterium]